MSPEETMFSDIATLGKQIQSEKEKRTQKLNRNREEYHENRQVAPVKNYKRNYYKNEPRYRIKNLDREHPINIKRPRLLADDNLSVLTDNTNDTSDGDSDN